MEYHPSITSLCLPPNIHSNAELLSVSSSVTHVTVDHGCCNEKELTALDLSAMKELTVFETATNCFKNVVECRVTGLEKLERVKRKYGLLQRPENKEENENDKE